MFTLPILHTNMSEIRKYVFKKVRNLWNYSHCIDIGDIGAIDAIECSRAMQNLTAHGLTPNRVA